MLPLEVFEAVIDQASDDPCALGQLSLTCRAFLPRARYHLFSDIPIRTVRRMESSRNLLDFCPWVRPLVQSLSLSFLVPTDNSIPNLRVLDIVPLHLLSELPNLHILNMEMKDAPVFDPDSAEASLSLHRSTLSCYQKYGGRIRNLELVHIPFQDIFDFIGLVSAFTGLEGVKLSDVWFRRHKRPELLPPAPAGLEMTARVKPLRLKHLHDFTGGGRADIRAVEYLLHSSNATLNHLFLTLDESRYSNFEERFERLLIRLSCLSSLTIAIPWSGIQWSEHSTRAILQEIQFATSIFKAVRVANVQDVRVEFSPESVASLGCCLSSGAGPLEACQALEEVLLTFPSCQILCHEPTAIRRPGRVDFWSPVIKSAFQRLDGRGRFTFTRGRRANRELSGRSETQPPCQPGHEAPVGCIVASRDSKLIVTASQDGTIIVWDTERNTIVQEWLAHTGPVLSLAMSPDGRHLVSVGGEEGSPLTLCDIGDGSRRAVASAGEGIIASSTIVTCAWSPDGAFIASVSADGTASIWDAQRLEHRGSELPRPQATSNSRDLQFSPDSRHLVWASRAPEDHPSSYATGCTMWTPFTVTANGGRSTSHWLPSHPSSTSVPVHAFAFDPDSRRLATAHGTYDDRREDCAVRIWDVATGAALAVLRGHTRLAVGVSFSPDGASVLSASYDGTRKIWDAESGEEIASFSAADEPLEIYQTRFSPDGVYVAAAGLSAEGSAVYLWRVGDGSKTAVFSEHRANVSRVAFSPDSEFLVYGDFEGLVHIRRLSNLIGP